MVNKIDTVVWDADNTLWDWISMHLQGMRKMAGKISEITEVPEEKVKQSMGRVYEKPGTFDYKPLVQEMDVVHEWASQIQDERERIRRVIDLAFAVHAAYTSSRQDTFRMYPEVPMVLSELNEAGVNNIILSDAPISKIIRRIKHFDIEDHFSMVCGRPDPMGAAECEMGEKPLEHYEKEREKAGFYNTKVKIVELVDQKKPDIDLAGLLKKTPAEIKCSTLVVGDNFEKDSGTADRNECYAGLARYGASNVQSLSGLSEFAPPSVVTRNAAGIDLSKKNLEMIQRMGAKLMIVDDVREILEITLGNRRRSKSRRPKIKL